jgi:hypothetical protein
MLIGESVVTKTPGGYRVTLYFFTRAAGTATVLEKLGSKTVGIQSAKVKAGNGTLILTVAKPGGYLLTLSIGNHAIRWTLTVK